MSIKYKRKMGEGTAESAPCKQLAQLVALGTSPDLSLVREARVAIHTHKEQAILPL